MSVATIPPAWRAVRRLLAVRLDNLGDLLMTTPALAALRQGLPEARITLLCSRAGAAAAPWLDMVHEAWAFDAPWVRQDGLPAQGLEAEARMLQRLRAGGFDAAVTFTTATQSPLPMAMLARQAGIALHLAHCRENPYALLSDRVPETDALDGGMRHEVQRQLALVARVGMRPDDDRLRFASTHRDRRQLRQRLAGAGLRLRPPYVVVHPGATAASRRWPAAAFGAAAGLLAARHGCQIVFCGAAHELPLVEEARAAMQGPSVSLAGVLGLGELGAAIADAALVVCNNSAPAHLAAALGTPVVSLYALTNPQHTPWRVPSAVLNHDVACRWCLQSSCPEAHHDCLRKVAPAQVAEAAARLLGLRTAAGFPVAASPIATPQEATA